MDTKLTLKLDKEVIEMAKAYVKERGTSLSKFVESILRKEVAKNDYSTQIELLPEVKELAAHFKGGKAIDENFDYKKSKAEYLIKKYGE